VIRASCKLVQIQILGSPERRLFQTFAPGVAYVAAEDQEGDKSIGTCFHIGESIFITARHVVENRKITKIATTVPSLNISFGSYVPSEARQIEGPYFHPKPEYDLAALRIVGLHAPQIPFLPVDESHPHEELMLKTVVVMGFPPIPGSISPVLLCTKAEVNASIVTYWDNQRVLVVSCLGRGGFSGGPALTTPRHCLGVVTRSLVNAPMPAELGFMVVVGPWPILELLDYNHIMPRYLRDEMWNERQKVKGA